jgi:hypothetical protein
MKKTVLLALIAVAVATPSIARTHYHHQLYRKTHEHHVSGDKPTLSHAHVTCDMVRAYVAQVGLEQAKALASSAGMSASEARQAARCLEKKV